MTRVHHSSKRAVFLLHVSQRASACFRRAPESGASVLVVRDTQQHVFGCFTSESWRVAPRYYGTGESFVFQTQVCILCFQTAGPQFCKMLYLL